MAQIAMDASMILKKYNYDIGVVHFHTIKPLDEKSFIQDIKRS